MCMESKGWAHFTMKLEPTDPQPEFPHTDSGFQQVFVARVSEEGRARDLYIACTKPTSHIYTYDMDTCKVSRDSDAPVVSIRRNPRPRGSTVYPYSFLGARTEQQIFCFLFVCLGHMCMERKGWAH